jgi:hypothetical protein
MAEHTFEPVVSWRRQKLRESGGAALSTQLQAGCAWHKTKQQTSPYGLSKPGGNLEAWCSVATTEVQHPAEQDPKVGCNCQPVSLLPSFSSCGNPSQPAQTQLKLLYWVGPQTSTQHSRSSRTRGRTRETLRRHSTQGGCTESIIHPPNTCSPARGSMLPCSWAPPGTIQARHWGTCTKRHQANAQSVTVTRAQHQALSCEAVPMGGTTQAQCRGRCMKHHLTPSITGDYKNYPFALFRQYTQLAGWNCTHTRLHQTGCQACQTITTKLLRHATGQ